MATTLQQVFQLFPPRFTLQVVFQMLAIVFNLIYAGILAYIKLRTEGIRSWQRVTEGATSKEIQEAINKVGQPFKSDRWYIKRALLFFTIGMIFQFLALLAPFLPGLNISLW